MSEHKAFASLSSGLLARKGEASPAMRRQSFGEMGQDLDDLGWNDMGDEPAGSGPSTAAAPSFGSFDDGDDNDRGVLAALGPLAGLSAQKAVKDQIQSVASQAKSVKEQQADIMAHFRIPDGEEADDGADLEDETAELWDPEAEDDGNIFSGHTDSVAESGAEEDGENLRFTADRYASDEGQVPFAADDLEDEQPEGESIDETAFEAESPVVEGAVEDTVEQAAVEEDVVDENVTAEEDDYGKVPFVTDAIEEDSSDDDVTMVDGYVDPESIDLSAIEETAAPEAIEEVAEEDAEAAIELGDETVAEDEPVEAFADDEAGDEDEIVDVAEAADEEDDVLELSDIEADGEQDDVLELAAEDEVVQEAVQDDAAVEADEYAIDHAVANDADDMFELEASDEMAEAAAAEQDFAEAAELHVEPVADEVETVDEDEIDVPTVADIVPMPAKRADTMRRPRRPRAQPGSKEKAAFTLRLDKQRHLKLRLASAVTGQSAQKMLIEALDRMLEEMPELEALAENAPEVGKKAG